MKSGDFDKLPLDNVQDMLTFLTIPDIVRFTMTCKLHYQSDTAPKWFWKPLLDTPLVDPLREYKINVPEKQKEYLELKFGYKKIITTIMSDRCVRCNAPTQGFDILSCSRACGNCWQCRVPNSYLQGEFDATSPFALCALSYAASHYLVSEKEIKNAGIVIFDTKSAQSKKVVNVKSIKQLGEEKFGGAAGLAKEKSKRAAKSKANWLAKCEVATAKNKSLPLKPDMVKYEEQKDDPKWKNLVAEHQWVAVYARYSTEYGYIENLRGVNSLRQPPSIVVSLDPVETILAKYPNLIHTAENPVIFQNLVEAVNTAKEREYKLQTRWKKHQGSVPRLGNGSEAHRCRTRLIPQFRVGNSDTLIFTIGQKGESDLVRVQTGTCFQQLNQIGTM